MTSEKPSQPEGEKKINNQTSVLPLLPTSPHSLSWWAHGRQLYWWSNEHLDHFFSFFTQTVPRCQPANFSLTFRERTQGWIFHIQGKFEAASPPLDIGSHHHLTVQEHSHYELRPRSEINLQPTQTSTLVSENLSGTEEHSCAVITPREFPSGAEAPSGQQRQTDQSPPATARRCLQLLSATAVAQQELPLRVHLHFPGGWSTTPCLDYCFLLEKLW